MIKQPGNPNPAPAHCPRCGETTTHYLGACKWCGSYNYTPEGHEVQQLELPSA